MKIPGIINDLIIEVAADNAEQLTELECKLNNITCYVVQVNDGVEESTFTDEAQDIFNVHYDKQTNDLVNLFHQQMSLVKSN